MKVEIAKSDTHIGMVLTPETEFEKSYLDELGCRQGEGARIEVDVYEEELTVLVVKRKSELK